MATSTNYTSIAYASETVAGTADNPVTFQVLPTTGGSPVSNITTATSEVIRSDRQTDDLTIVDATISGDLNYELSYTAYQPLMKALLENDTLSGKKQFQNATADGGASTTLINGTGIDAIFAVGDAVKVTSSTDSDIDGGYIVIDNSVTDKISVSPAFSATDVGSISDVEVVMTDSAVNGADEPNSYTFRKLAVSNATTYRWYYYGCRINTMNFNFATGSILNGSLGIIGQTETTGTSVITGETADTAVASYNILNSVNSIGSIYIEGVSLGTCSFSSLDLSIDNQITEAKSIGTLGACDTAAYSVQITGNVEVYFSTLDMYNKFLNSEAFSVSIVLEDGEGAVGPGNVIGISMPRCKFETLETPIDGKDSFLMQSGTFRALRYVDAGASEDYTIKFSFTDHDEAYA